MNYVIQLFDPKHGWEDFAFPRKGREREEYDEFCDRFRGTRFRLVKMEVVADTFFK